MVEPNQNSIAIEEKLVDLIENANFLKEEHKLRDRDLCINMFIHHDMFDNKGNQIKVPLNEEAEDSNESDEDEEDSKDDEDDDEEP